MVTLGAIVAVPMHMPDRGIIQGLVVLVCAVVFQRGITWISSKYYHAQHTLEGTETLLVKDGVLQLEGMERTRIPRQQLFSQLREKNIFNLGNVQRMYLEASGDFSVFQFSEPTPGLPTFPPDDTGVLESSRKQTNDNTQACCNCGTVGSSSEQTCPACGNDQWTPATL
jgi:uncharacterized membrane protein YcaP (DUF421 family)